MTGRNSEVASLKRRLADPRALCSALSLLDGSKNQPGGVTIRCPSPGHTDRSPSCSVTLAQDGALRVHCFGCGFSGDALSLIGAVYGHRMKGPEFRALLDVARRLADHMGPITAMATTPTGDRAAHQLVADVLLAACPLKPGSTTSQYLDRRGVLEEAIAGGWGELPDTEQEIQALLGRADSTCGSDLVEGAAPFERLTLATQAASAYVRSLSWLA